MVPLVKPNILKAYCVLSMCLDYENASNNEIIPKLITQQQALPII